LEPPSLQLPGLFCVDTIPCLRGLQAALGASWKISTPIQRQEIVLKIPPRMRSPSGQRTGAEHLTTAEFPLSYSTESSEEERVPV